MKVYSGQASGKDKKIAIVVSRFNSVISENLLNGAVQYLIQHQVAEDDIHVAWCPGAFEIPSVAAKMADSGHYDAIITLGAVIRGETPHFDFVAGQCAAGVQSLSVEAGIPVIFGVLTTDTVEQAWNRAGLKSGNKGGEAAAAALEMSNLFTELP